MKTEIKTPLVVVKNGKTEKGVQKYYNRQTKKYHLEASQRAPEYIKFMAIFLYMRGLSSRVVGQLFGVAHTTILDWIYNYGYMFDFSTTVDKSKTYDDVEIDEMFSFCEKKTLKFMYGLLLTEQPIKF